MQKTKIMQFLSTHDKLLMIDSQSVIEMEEFC